MDDVFTGFFPEKQIIKIDRLVLDVGDISEENIEHKLEEILRRQLPLVLSNIKLDNGTILKKVPKDAWKVDLLEFYFQNGFFPWWYQEEEPFDPDLMVLNLLDQSPEKAKLFFHKNLLSAQVRKRIEYQLSGDTLQAVHRLMVGEGFMEYEQYLEQLERLHQHPKIRGIAKKDYRKYAEILLLQYLGQESSIDISPKNFGIYFLEQASQKFNISATEINDYYHRKIRKRSASQTEKNWLETLENWMGEASNQRRLSPLSKVQIVVEFLSKGLIPPGQGPISNLEHIEGLIIELNEQGHVVWMEQIRQLLENPNVVARIEQQLSTNTIEFIQKAIYGERIYRLINQIQKNLEGLRQIHGFPVALEKRLKPAFHAAILAYFPRYDDRQDFVEQFIRFFRQYISKNESVNWDKWWERLKHNERENIQSSRILIRLFQKEESEKVFIGNLSISESEVLVVLENLLKSQKAQIHSDSPKLLEISKLINQTSGYQRRHLKHILSQLFQQDIFVKSISKNLNISELFKLGQILLEQEFERYRSEVAVISGWFAKNPISTSSGPFSNWLWIALLRVKSDPKNKSLENNEFWKLWISELAVVANISEDKLRTHLGSLPQRVIKQLPTYFGEVTGSYKTDNEIQPNEQYLKLVKELFPESILKAFQQKASTNEALFWEATLEHFHYFNQKQWQRFNELLREEPIIQKEAIRSLLFAKQKESKLVQKLEESSSTKLLESINDVLNTTSFDIQHQYLIPLIKILQTFSPKLVSKSKIAHFLQLSVAKFWLEDYQLIFQPESFVQTILEHYSQYIQIDKKLIINKLIEHQPIWSNWAGQGIDLVKMVLKNGEEGITSKPLFKESQNKDLISLGDKMDNELKFQKSRTFLIQLFHLYEKEIPHFDSKDQLVKQLKIAIQSDYLRPVEKTTNWIPDFLEQLALKASIPLKKILELGITALSRGTVKGISKNQQEQLQVIFKETFQQKQLGSKLELKKWVRQTQDENNPDAGQKESLIEFLPDEKSVSKATYQQLFKSFFIQFLDTGILPKKQSLPQYEKIIQIQIKQKKPFLYQLFKQELKSTERLKPFRKLGLKTLVLVQEVIFEKSTKDLNGYIEGFGKIIVHSEVLPSLSPQLLKKDLLLGALHTAAISEASRTSVQEFVSTVIKVLCFFHPITPNVLEIDLAKVVKKKRVSIPEKLKSYFENIEIPARNLDSESCFFQFLRHGTLTKTGPFKDVKALEKWLETGINNFPEKLKKRLKKELEEPALINRVFQQFSTSTIRALNRMLAGSQMVELDQHLQQFRAFFESQPYPAPVLRRLDETLTTGLLQYLVHSSDKKIHVQSLFQSLVHHLGEQFQHEMAQKFSVPSPDIDPQVKSDDTVADPTNKQELLEKAFLHFLRHGKVEEKDPLFEIDHLEPTLIEISRQVSPDFIAKAKPAIQIGGKPVLTILRKKLSVIGLKIINRFLEPKWLQKQNEVLDKIISAIQNETKSLLHREKIESALQVSLLEMTVLHQQPSLEKVTTLVAKKLEIPIAGIKKVIEPYLEESSSIYVLEEVDVKPSKNQIPLYELIREVIAKEEKNLKDEHTKSISHESDAEKNIESENRALPPESSLEPTAFQMLFERSFQLLFEKRSLPANLTLTQYDRLLQNQLRKKKDYLKPLLIEYLSQFQALKTFRKFSLETFRLTQDFVFQKVSGTVEAILSDFDNVVEKSDVLPVLSIISLKRDIRIAALHYLSVPEQKVSNIPAFLDTILQVLEAFYPVSGETLKIGLAKVVRVNRLKIHPEIRSFFQAVEIPESKSGEEDSFFNFLKTGSFSNNNAFKSLDELEKWIAQKVLVFPQQMKARLIKALNDSNQFERAIQQLSEPSIKMLNLFLGGAEIRQMEEELAELKYLIENQDISPALKRRLDMVLQFGLLYFLSQNAGSPYLLEKFHASLAAFLSHKYGLPIPDYVATEGINAPIRKELQPVEIKIASEVKELLYFFRHGKTIKSSTFFESESIESVLKRMSNPPPSLLLSGIKSALKQGGVNVLAILEKDFSTSGLDLIGQLLEPVWVAQHHTFLLDLPILIQASDYSSKQVDSSNRLVSMSLLEVLIQAPRPSINLLIDLVIEKLVDKWEVKRDNLITDLLNTLLQAHNDFSEKSKSKLRDYFLKESIPRQALSELIQANNIISVHSSKDSKKIIGSLLEFVKGKKIKSHFPFKNIIEAEEQLEYALTAKAFDLVKIWEKDPILPKLSLNLLDLFSPEMVLLFIKQYDKAKGNPIKEVRRESQLLIQKLIFSENFKTPNPQHLQELLLSNLFQKQSIIPELLAKEIIKKIALDQQIVLPLFLESIKDFLSPGSLFKKAHQKLHKEIEDAILEQEAKINLTDKQKQQLLEKERSEALDAVKYFLKQGAFANHHSLQSPKEAEKIILQILGQDPIKLWQAFKSIKHSKKLAERIEAYFPSILLKLVEVFEKEQKIKLTPIIQTWEKVSWSGLLPNRALANLPVTRVRALALNTLLQSRSKNPKTVQFIQSLFSELATENHSQFEAFFREIRVPLQEHINEEVFNNVIKKLEDLFFDKELLEVEIVFEELLQKKAADLTNEFSQIDELDLLATYLEKGKIPWWAPSSPKTSIDGTLDNLIETAFEKTLLLLQSSWQNTRQQKRLLDAIAPNTWISLAKKKFGNYSILVEAQAQALDIFIDSKNYISNSALKKQAIVWGSIVDYMLYSYPFSSESFVIASFEKTIQKIGKAKLEMQTSYFEILQKEALPGKPAFIRLKNIVNKWIENPEEIETITNVSFNRAASEMGISSKTEEKKELADSIFDPIAEKQKRWSDRQKMLLEDLQNIRYFLEHGSLRVKGIFPTKKSFIQAFELMMKEQASQMRKLLGYLMQNQEAVLRILATFSGKNLIQIFDLLYGGKREIILTHWKDLINMLPGIVRRFSKSDMQGFFLYQAFIYFSKANTGLFSITDFLAHLLIELGKKEDKNPLELLHAINERFEQNTSRLKAKWEKLIPQLYKLLEEHLQKGQQKIKWKLESVGKNNPVEDVMYIHNAGLSIISPFLPRYLDMLGMMENKKFKDEESAIRAVHLIQYIGTGQTETEEPLLVFNKILCGLPIETPIPRGIELTAQEVETTEQMLNAVLAHWKGIGTTTLEGLRGGFFIREGKLEWNEDAYWNLDVEKKSYDILMNSLPWSISIIQHPWMEHRIQVTWY